jgi:hypothetical protein
MHDDTQSQAQGAPDLDIDKLEALARAATPGPWAEATRGPNNMPVIGTRGLMLAHVVTGEGFQPQADANGAFIAAANPATVIALIEQARRATAPHAAEVQSDLTTMNCPSCNGHGLIGGHSGQTAESYQEHGEGCDDCDGQGKIIVSRKDLAEAAQPAAVPGGAVQHPHKEYADRLTIPELVERLRADAAGGSACDVFMLDRAADLLESLATPPVAVGETEQQDQASEFPHDFRKWDLKREDYVAPQPVGALVAMPERAAAEKAVFDALADMRTEISLALERHVIRIAALATPTTQQGGDQ